MKPSNVDWKKLIHILYRILGLDSQVTFKGRSALSVWAAKG